MTGQLTEPSCVLGNVYSMARWCFIIFCEELERSCHLSEQFQFLYLICLLRMTTVIWRHGVVGRNWNAIGAQISTELKI